TSTRRVWAPASSAFSRSSLTTDAGRSTTSPAAMRLATASGRMRMRDILFPKPYVVYAGGHVNQDESFWHSTTEKAKRAAPFNAPRSAICFRLEGDGELIQLLLVDVGRRFRHQVLGGGGLSEGNHFTNRFFPRQEHDHAVDAQRDAAVRRRAVGQRVEEKAKAAAQLLFGQAESAKQALLNVLPVDSNAARAEFIAVENEVVAFRAHFPRRRFKFVKVLVHDAGKRMLSAHPLLVRFAPFKQREAGEPKKFPLRPVDDAERLC